MGCHSKLGLNVQNNNAIEIPREYERFITHIMRLFVKMREALYQVQKWVERERESNKLSLGFLLGLKDGARIRALVSVKRGSTWAFYKLAKMWFPVKREGMSLINCQQTTKMESDSIFKRLLMGSYGSMAILFLVTQ